MEKLPTEIEEKMGQFPTFNDRFAPRGAAAKDGPGRDRFADQAGRAGVVDHFGNVKSATRGDAFAGGRIAKAAPVDRFSVKPERVETPPPVEAVAPPPPSKRPALHVVAAKPEMASEPAEVKYQDLKREEAWRRKAARTSSLVLVSGAATAADVIDAPPPAPPAPAPKAETPPPPPLLAEKAPPRPGGGGGGGSGAGSGEPPRERGFNQDDFVGVMLGAAVVALLLLWLMRGGQQQDNQIVGVQSAMNEPIALPAAAPPPAPLPPKDPFGDQAVDLTPKGPIPEAAPETSKAAAPEAAPAPGAAPVPIGDRAMHAWFCTAGSKLTKASRTTLEGELEQFSTAFAGKELVVRGYADTRGTSVYNSALGGERAKVVADFLRTKGLNVVDAAGVGELDGLDDNQNCSNQRRVDVFVKGGPGETPSRACAPEPDVEDLVCG